MTGAFGTLNRFTARIAIIVLLAVAVSGLTYAVAYSPVAATAAVRRPPSGSQPAVSAPTSVDPATALSGAVQAGAAPVAPSRQAPEGGRPAGGRPPSLSRGLPELAMYTVVILVIASVVAGGQAWLRSRRGPATSDPKST